MPKVFSNFYCPKKIEERRKFDPGQQQKKTKTELGKSIKMKF